jgi:hypothetical protein
MGMRVLFCQGINYNDKSSQYHYSKTEEIRPRRLFPENYERQESADKGGYRIVCACFGCSDNSLRPDIKEYAESVCNESEQEREREVSYTCELLSEAQSNDQRAKSRKDTLQEYDMVGIFA